MVNLAETVCHSPGSHLNSLFFSPPPEDIHTSLELLVDQSDSKIILGLDVDEEPPTPAGFSFSDGEEKVQPFNIVSSQKQEHVLAPVQSLAYVHHTPEIDPKPSSQQAISSSEHFSTRPTYISSAGGRPTQDFSHSRDSFVKPTPTASADFCGFRLLDQSITPLTRSSSTPTLTKLNELVGYSYSDEDSDEGTDPPRKSHILGESEGRTQDLDYQGSQAPSRQPSTNLSRQISPFICLPSEEILEASVSLSKRNDIPQSIRNSEAAHHQSQQRHNGEMSSSRTTSVAGSPSRSTLTDRAMPNNRKRPLSPTTPLPPKRVKATGPFADSDDSDDPDDSTPKVTAPPKRPVLNLQRLKQAIAKNNQNASNAQSQTTVRKEGPVRQENGGSSQSQKKTNSKEPQHETAVAGTRNAVVVPLLPISIAQGGTNGKQEAGLKKAQNTAHPVGNMKVAHSKPPSSQLGQTKLASVYGTPRLGDGKVDKAGAHSGATRKPAEVLPVTSFQPATQKPTNLSASVGLTKTRKISLQPDQVKKTGANVQPVAQPKPAERPIIGSPVMTTKQQNSFQMQDAKRASSPTVPVPVKQKPGDTPPISLVTNKTQPAGPKASPLVRSAMPTLPKQSPVTPKPTPNGRKPAPVMATSSVPKATLVPFKIGTSQKPTQTTPKIAPETQQVASVQITPKRSLSTPQASSVTLKNAQTIAPASKVALPGSKQPKSAQAASVPPKEVVATPQVNPSTTKAAQVPRSHQPPKPAPTVPSALKTKDGATKEASASQAASIAPQTTSIIRKIAQVTQKSTIPYVSPMNQADPASITQEGSTTQKTTPAEAISRKMTPIITEIPSNPRDIILVPLKATPTPSDDTLVIGEEVPMVHKEVVIALQKTATRPEISPVIHEVNLALPRSANEPVSLAISTSNTRKEPPFFEYTVFQKTFPASGEDKSTPSVQIATFTNIDNANAQAEKLHLAAAHHHPLVYDIQFSAWNTKPDAFDCVTYLGTFAPVEYPTRKSYIKIWVERHAASAHTKQCASPKTHFLAKTVFILRLRKLIDPDPDLEDEDMDDSDSEDEGPIRVSRALPEGFAELYTTLDAANRAARRLQIELRHEKEQKHPSKRAWQEKEANELRDKVADLEKNKGYWESQFNEVRLGGDKFELVVEQARLSGPRNL